MPGSPPTSTTDPGTMPPPKTKSNSRRPVCHRRTPDPSPRADSRTGGRADGELAGRCARPPVRPTGSSTSVFQAPHASQRPPHLGWSAPHSVQRNTDLLLDILSFARRVVVEARVFLLEVQLHGARRPVPLLAHDHFGDPLDTLVGLGVDRPVVELLAINEAD